MGVLEERGREREEEVSRAREQLRAEQSERHRERDTHTQVCHYQMGVNVCSDMTVYTHVSIPVTQALQDCEARIRYWQKACEEVRKEKKRRSITVSDMDSEVTRLTKVRNTPSGYVIYNLKPFICSLLPFSISLLSPLPPLPSPLLHPLSSLFSPSSLCRKWRS